MMEPLPPLLRIYVGCVEVGVLNFRNMDLVGCITASQ
jgi:hypothetical protein